MKPPAPLDRIRADTIRIGFALSSAPETGSLLRLLAASRPGGRVLELGTGTGIGTAWILDGMDRDAILVSVDSDPAVQNVARQHLGGDPRVTFHLGDGAEFLQKLTDSFDLVYADAWPGKFLHLNEALACVRAGGFYFVDDLLPQPNWPNGHAEKVTALVEDLQARAGFVATRLDWSSGLMILVKVR